MAQALQKEMIDTQNLPKWDLTDFFPSYDSREVDEFIKKCDVRTSEFEKKWEGKVQSMSSSELAVAIKEYDEIEGELGYLISYAFLEYSADVSDAKILSFYQNTQETVTTFSTRLLFFTLGINSLSEEVFEKHLDHSGVRHYHSWLKDIRVYKPYQLSEELEKFISEKSVTGHNAWTRLFEETVAGLRFDKDGEKVPSHEMFTMLSDADENTRKKAAKEIGKVFGENKSIFSLITNTLAKDKAIEQKWRGYPSPVTSRNLSNLVEDEVVDALVTTVRKNYENLSHRYFKMKAKWMGKEKLNYWDRNAPLPGADHKDIEWNDAQNIVIDAYDNFSPLFSDICKQFFDRNWIDAQVRDGKMSGAFSHSTVPQVHPYILMSYQGKPRDVMTLAHELGHGVHQYLSREQGPLMSNTSLTLSETASVFGEMMTFQSMLEKETDARKRSILIANKVEDMLNTVVRQIAFFTFEERVHNERKNGELSVDQICDIWMDVQKESLGPAFTFDEEYKYYWTYIPHFIHTPFYVYAYAFGDCLVNSLYALYKNGHDGFKEKYIDMLKAGGSRRHKEILAPFGLNATNPDFWEKGLVMISEFIDQLENCDLS